MQKEREGSREARVVLGKSAVSQLSPEGDAIGVGRLGCQVLLAELPLSP